MIIPTICIRRDSICVNIASAIAIMLSRLQLIFITIITGQTDMSSLSPIQCPQCDTFYLPHQQEDHQNMHIYPSKLAPKTLPNDMRKIQLAKVIITEHKTDTTDIALRSLLPDQIPQPQEERKEMRSPESPDQPISLALVNPQGERDRNEHSQNRMRDRLDLTSTVVMNDLSKDQIRKLVIEKEVDIQPIRAVVPKKQLHKFQNSNYAARETTHLGGCDKKYVSNVVNGGRVGAGVESFQGLGVRAESGEGFGPREVDYMPVGFGQNVQGYQIKADNSYMTSASKRSTVVVPISRKTSNPNDFKPIDTKSNQGFLKNGRKGSYGMEEGSQNLQSRSSRVKAVSSSQVGNYEMGSKIYDNIKAGYSNQLHLHECPECHGFYCAHCGSTIPPEYRPFWDADQAAEMIEYYKRRVRECRDAEREKDKKMRLGCGQCNRDLPK